MTTRSQGDTKIEGGIEWFKVYDKRGGWLWEAQCARCGSSVEWLDCWPCGGDGAVERDIGDDACEDIIDVPCGTCRGKGGANRCVSSPEFCHANPLPGREHIESTALRAEAWND